MIVADPHVARRIAAELGELAGRRRTELTDVAAVKPHPVAVDGGAGFPPQGERILVAMKLDADFLEDRVGGLLDFHQAFFIEQVVGRETAFDAGDY